jgi:hypothetical protein
MKQACRKARGFQVMLHKPRNISVIFQYKYGLIQTVRPRPAAVYLRIAAAAQNH